METPVGFGEAEQPAVGTVEGLPHLVLGPWRQGQDGIGPIVAQAEADLHLAAVDALGGETPQGLCAEPGGEVRRGG
jgi:hypothetical protein